MLSTLKKKLLNTKANESTGFRYFFFAYAGKAIHATIGRIALVMCLSCASAGTVQVGVCALVQMCQKDQTSINTNEVANVILGALVAVTGCCPFIDPPFAILIGSKCRGVSRI